MASSALAPPQAVDVTLALFAGTKLDITPSDCPEGISPDTQDGIYLPGGWFSRPGLAKLYATGALTAGTQVLYEKTYIQPNNDPLNLLLTSDGKLWVEDVANNPDNPSSIFQITPALYAQSVTAFGREYIAFSDLLHGQGVPLQYDGTNLDRVTQDAPGAAPTVADFISLLAISGSIGLGAAIVFNAGGAVESGNTVTITTTTPHGFSPQQYIYVSVTGSAASPYNGVVQVVATPSATTFTYLVGTLGLSPAGPGICVPAVGYLAVTGIVGKLQLNIGDAIVISANNSSFVNGSAAVSLAGDVNTDTTGYVVTWVSGNQFSSAMVGQPIEINGVSSTVGSVGSPTSLLLAGPVTPSLSNVAYSASLNNPENWPVVSIVNDGGGTWTIGFSFIAIPSDVEIVAGSGGGTVSLGGQSSPGVHQVVCMFLTRNGGLTAPSPPLRFVSAGSTQWSISNLPTGPANVVARVLGFTGAGGDNYFVIPASVTLPDPTSPTGQSIVILATVVPDNTSTTAIFDVPDNTLFAATAIDQIGNDLFAQRVLGPVLGFFTYASRLMCWGDFQKIENLLNMGFCGGYLSGVLTAPLGWAVVTAGGLLVNGGPWAAGMVWRITGDGSGNPRGQISQSAYQDAFGDAILLPNTAYILRLWAKAAVPLVAGNIVVDLYDPGTTTVLASATIPCANATAIGSFLQVNFTAETPATIPADTVLRVYVTGMANAAVILLGEVEPVYAQNPFNNVLVHASYIQNPEGFAQVTGELGASDDDSAVQTLALLRTSVLLESLDGVHIFQDNDGEPDTWQVNQLTRAVGAVSLRGGDPGKFGTGDAAEDWAIIASQNGAYLFAGGEFWKVTQEVSRGSLPQAQDPRPTWDDTNWAAKQTIVAKNDPAKRRCYFALPLNGATQPNYVAVLDYREMDTASQIASAPPVHITIQGKMKSSDLTRKWSWWNVSANDIEILVRPGNVRDLFFAGGTRGGQSFGNIYSLNPSSLHDDDYGQIFPYYTTYAFTDHDQEQALNLGSDLHLYTKIHAFITGVGQVLITPIVNSLYNFQPTLSPRILTADTDAGTFLASDLEWTTVSLRGQRVFFRISVIPLPGSIDVQVRLQKFVVGMMKEPIARFRQSGI